MHTTTEAAMKAQHQELNIELKIAA